jgi:hypothetical protein
MRIPESRISILNLFIFLEPFCKTLRAKESQLVFCSLGIRAIFVKSRNYRSSELNIPFGIFYFRVSINSNFSKKS